MIPYLSILIIFPLAAAGISLFLPTTKSSAFRWINLLTVVAQLSLLICAISAYDRTGSMQLIERHNWFSVTLGSWGNLKAEYFIGIDGMSLPLLALTVVIMIIVALSSWNVSKNPKGYFILLLILNTAVVGTFVSLDFLLFYLFFEFMLLPIYFLIGIWGGPGREYASIKFLLYTLLGSLFILIALIGLFLSTKSPVPGEVTHTFDLLAMTNPLNHIEGTVFSVGNFSILGLQGRTWGFLLLFIGFGIKMPIVPFHTWLPDAHVEASTPISVILAALLLKAGAYGMLRIAFPIFPDVALSMSNIIATVAVVSIIYGALNALASKDLKRLVAYSSVSHMGFVLLGIASATVAGVTGAVYQMVSHGLIAAALFLLVGVLYDRTGDRTIANYSGLHEKVPAFFTVTLIIFFAALGLPAFSGFIAEILILFGAFQTNNLTGLFGEGYAIVATTGIILGAGYFLWTIQRMFFGKYYVQSGLPHPTDLTRREYLMLLPLIFFIFIFGIYPQFLMDFVNPFATEFVRKILEYRI